MDVRPVLYTLQAPDLQTCFRVLPYHGVTNEKIERPFEEEARFGYKTLRYLEKQGMFYNSKTQLRLGTQPVHDVSAEEF